MERVPNDELFEILLSILHILSQRYPEAFQVSFDKVVHVLLGSVQAIETRNVLVWKWIDENSQYWSKHLVYGIQILLDCNTELQVEFGIKCEPNGSTYQPLVKDTSMTSTAIDLMNRYDRTLKSLYNGCWGYIVGNIVLHEQLLHIIRWNIEIGGLVMLKILSPAWFRCFYSALHTTLRTGPTMVIRDCLDRFLEKHLAIAKKTYERENDLRAIHEWLECFQVLIPNNLPVLPESISGLFLHPKGSFLMKKYRMQVSGKPNMLERLIETTSLLLPSAPVNEWLGELEYFLEMAFDRGSSAVTLGADYDHVRLKASNLGRLIDFTLLCLKAIATPHEKDKNVIMFKKLIQSHEKLVDLLETNTSSRKIGIESALLLTMFDIAEINGFFFPKLNVGRSAHIENSDLVDYQMSLLKQWAIPNHFTSNSMGLMWLNAWVHSIKDRNVLDTLVGDSFVLTTVEQILLRYLKKCSLETDPLLRRELGNIWKVYLTHFGGNRRSETNTAMIVRFFLQRVQDVDVDVRNVFFDCMCLLDSFDTALSIENLSTALKRDYIEEFKYLVMASPSSGTFQTMQFRLMANFLGMGSYLQESDDQMDTYIDFDADSDWLRNLYFACQAEHVFSLMNADPVLLLVAQSSYECLLFWALWETARFFIITRLNTPFGSPLQTLEAIGKTLEAYLKLFEMAKKETVVHPQILNFMERLSLFLTMIDFFESQIIVASRGSTTTCPAPPKPCLVFFSSNVKVCQDWFSRMRSKLSGAANILKEEGLLLRHSFKSFFEGLALLRDNALNKTEVWNLIMRNCLFSINNALLAKKDHDGLIGLYALWKRNVSLVPSEIELRDPSILQLLAASIQFSEGKIEMGAKTLEGILPSCKLQYVQREAQEKLFHCYASAGNWKSMANVLETIKPTNQEFEKYFAADLNALSYWNHSQELVPFTPVTDILLRGPPIAFDHISMNGIRNAFQNTNCDLQESLGLLKSIMYLSARKPIERCAENLIWSQFLVQFSANHLSLDSASQIRLGKAKPTDRITELSLYNKDLLTMIKIYSLSKTAEKLGKARKARDPDLDEIGGLLANLARNTRNIKLAHELLDSSLRNLTLSASMRKQYKQARLLYQEKRLSEASKVLWKVVETPLPSLTTADQEVVSKSLLLLAGWNSEHPMDLKQTDFPDLFREVFGTDFPFNMSQMRSEDIEYSLLKYAIRRAPDYSKSWFAYGSFNYRFGRSLLEDLNSSYTAPYFLPELRDLEAVLRGTTLSCSDIMKSLLQELREHEHESVAKNWRDEGNLSSEKLPQVELIVEHIRKSIFEKFDTACSAYFRYLLVQSTGDSKTEKSRRKQGDIITATLRLVRIFARYGVGLQATFREGFADTPLHSWTVVIPQLFSRLYHPEAIVRQEITNLLCRIASEYPHLMCYPAVLGAAEAQIDQDRDAEDAYNQIIEAIRNVNSELVPEMTKWTQELRRITVLWEETWLMGLDHLKNDFNDRITKIQEDLERIDNNTTLAEMERVEIKANTVTNLMKPVLFFLDKLCDQTYRMEASSPHEVNFIEKYSERMEQAYRVLEEAVDLEEVTSSWATFQDIYKELTNFGIQCRMKPLQLSELSPYLSNLSQSHIYIPGIGLDDEKVASCHPTIKVLPSKTKPKKIELLSTTGEKFVFLLKGHEDLHLDEKIEQFLGITNTLFYCDKPSRSRGLNVRTYNVIPFASNFGMIQWVDNAHGLFSLYRKSQLHDYNMRVAVKKETGSIPPPPRPHELFAKKVMQAHKEGKLNKKEPRHKWPMKTMLDIWHELRKETPSDIMANELWTSSYSADNWWNKTCHFSRSLAVMSIVGYALGLGDRHLDNILIDLKRGDVVHIDFNVCFEKGKRLRIPETVPFRLTQNLLRALGPSGVDGHFRIACENVMRLMRENREVLLTLLEAFIYDPLVDWIKEDGFEKQILELNVNIGLFCSRIGKPTLPR
jgi:hypothetical protein